jgi:hypothetical protein
MLKRRISVFVIVALIISLAPPLAHTANADFVAGCTLSVETGDKSFDELGFVFDVTSVAVTSNAKASVTLKTINGAAVTSDAIAATVKKITVNDGEAVNFSAFSTTVTNIQASGTDINAGFAYVQNTLAISVSKNDSKKISGNVVVKFYFEEESGVTQYSVSAMSEDESKGHVATPVKIDTNTYTLTATPAYGYALDRWEYRTEKDANGDFTGDYTADDESLGKSSYTVAVSKDTEYKAVFKKGFFNIVSAYFMSASHYSIEFGYFYNYPATVAVKQLENRYAVLYLRVENTHAVVLKKEGAGTRYQDYPVLDLSLKVYAGKEADEDNLIWDRPLDQNPVIGGYLSGDFGIALYIPEMAYTEDITLVFTTGNGADQKDCHVTETKTFDISAYMVKDTLKEDRDKALEDLREYYEENYGESNASSDKTEQDVEAPLYKKYGIVRFMLRDIYSICEAAINGVSADAQDANALYEGFIETAKTDFARAAAVAGLDSTGLSEGKAPYPYDKAAVANHTGADPLAPSFAYLPKGSVAVEALMAAFEYAAPGKWHIVSYRTTGYDGIFVTSLGYNLDRVKGSGGLSAGTSPNSGICYLYNNEFALRGFGSQPVGDRGVVRVGGYIDISKMGQPIEFDKDDMIWALAALHDRYGIVSNKDDGALFDLADEAITPEQEAAYDTALSMVKGWDEVPGFATKETLAAAYAALFAVFPGDAEAMTRYDLPDDVIKVMNLIRGIGSVTPESKDAIDAARTAYDNLEGQTYNGQDCTEEQIKALVPNLATLTEAQAAYARLTAPVAEYKTALDAAVKKLSGAKLTVSSIGGEWALIAAARAADKPPLGSDFANGYLGELNKQLNSGAFAGTANGKYTEYARVTLALSALGIDASSYSVAGKTYNLAEKLTDYGNVIKQGINGPVFALLALDAKPYFPENTAIREQYIQDILAARIKGGGWALDKSSPADPDVTAMVLQALAKYRGGADVEEAINSGIGALKGMQDEDYGGFYSFKQYNSESAAQVIVAFTALGTGPTGPDWTVKEARNPLTALLSFYDAANAGFRHTLNGAVDQMAAEQAACALAAYDRYISGKNSLYDMSDAFGPEEADKGDLLSAAADAQSLTEADYKEGWEKLKAALTAAEETCANAEATQEAVDKAESDLLTAIGDLITDVPLPKKDTGVLAFAISIAGTFAETGYTAGTWSALQSALQNANSVKNGGDAEQEAIDEAANGLIDAISALEREKIIDKTLLEATTAAAISLTEADYAPGTWETYASALTGAQSAAPASQDDADYLARTLIRAIAGLTKASESDTDYTAATSVLNAIKTAVADDTRYTAGSRASLAAATEKYNLANALRGLRLEEPALNDTVLKHVRDYAVGTLPESTYTTASRGALVNSAESAVYMSVLKLYTVQEEIDNVLKGVLSGLKSLERATTGANRSLLNRYTERAKELAEPGYTAASYEVLKTALTAAEDLADNASQPDIDAARKALVYAIRDLARAVDKTALAAAIADAGKITNSGYTAESWKYLEDALASAVKIQASETATQKAVNKALSELRLATASLAFPGVNPPGPGDPTGGTVWISVTDPGASGSQRRSYFAKASFPLRSNETAFSLLQRTNLPLRTTGHPVHAGVYIEAIDGFGEFDAGALSGWMYRVNGTFPNYSSSLCALRDGDYVEWLYTRKLGSDIGGVYATDGENETAKTAETPAGGGIPSVTVEIEAKEALGSGGGSSAKAEVKAEDVNIAIGKAKEKQAKAVSVTVKGDENTKAADVTLPKESAKTIADNGLALVVKSSVGDLSLGTGALASIAAKPGDTLEVLIASEGRSAALPADRNKAFTLTVKVGDAALSDLGGTAAVALPYAKAADEDAELLTVYKLENDGSYTEVKDAKYDAALGKETFTTSEAGSYVVSEWISPFADIQKGEWYYKSVRYAYSSGLMNGTDEKTYAPRATLTRAMLVTVLAREAGADTNPDGGAWYEKAIAWGTASGLTDGRDPTDAITREQFAVMLYRHAGSPKASGSLAAYGDAHAVSAWAEEALAWAVETGLITGRTETTLAPKDTATRAEAAALLQRYLENIA